MSCSTFRLSAREEPNMPGKSANNKKTPRPAQTRALPKGIKAVPAPRNPKLRHWLRDKDITAGAGCRTVHAQPVG